MTKKFTKLIAAAMLLLLITPPLWVWGQVREVTYELTTSISVGDVVLLVAQGSNYNKELNGFTTSGTIVGTVADFTDTPNGVYPLTVVAGYNGENIAFKNSDNNYLSWSSGSSLSLSETLNENSSWTFTYSYSTTYIKNVKDNSRMIKYNTGNPRFACYTSTSGGVVFPKIYKQVSTGPTQLSTPTNFTATPGNAQATFTWDAVGNASSYTIIRKIGETWTADADTVELFKNVNLTNGQFIGTGLTNGETYICKVRANGDGSSYLNSDLSNEQTFIPATTYNVNIASSITGGTVGANLTSATEGTEISLTKEANGGYGFTSWNVYKTDDQSTTVTVSDDKFTMPAYDVTVNATFTPYTVTLNAGSGTVNSETITTWNVTMNSGNLYDASSPCSEMWSFDGWSTTAVSEQTTTAPSYVNTAFEPTSNITLYAVYTKTESSGTTFNGTTSTGDFLIYAAVGNTNYYADGTGSKINNTTTASEATTYTFEQPTGYNSGEFAIKTGSDYITYSSGTDLGTSTDPYKWTISQGTKGTWRVTSGTSGRALIYRAGSTNKFGGYSTGNVTSSGTEYYDLEVGEASTTYFHSTPNCMETVATPTFDVAEGIHNVTQIIVIECETTGAAIYYTLNGDEPTNVVSGTNFLYDENVGVEISVTTTLKAKAFKEEMNPSATKTATYTILHDVTEPTLPASQLFTSASYSVVITVPTNTTVYYTTDDTTPTNESTQYTAAFNIDATTTVKAIAYDADGCASDVVSATYTKAYTVYFYDYDNATEPFTYVEVAIGSTLDLENMTAPNGFVFMGWTTSTISGVSATAPDPLYTAGTSITVNNNMDLYAVYAMVETEVSTENKSLTLKGGDVTWGSGSGYKNGTATIDGISFTIENGMKSNDYIQLRIGDGRVYNTTALGTEITKVTVTVGINTILVYEGTESNPSSTTVTGVENVYTFSGGTNYLAIKGDGKYTQVYFTVDYVKTNSNTTYSNYCTTVTILSLGDEVTTYASACSIDPDGFIIETGQTLSVGALGNANPAYLIIEDGGQLICNNSVNATLEKEIDAAVNWNTTGADAWYLIASPVNGFATNNIVAGTTTTDLYSYNEPTNYWFNAQGTTNPFTSLTRGNGYLYANNTGNDLTFIGEMPATNTNIEKTLSYECSNESLKGFNLVGNPFTCNLTSDNVKIHNGTELTNITSYLIVENGTELTTVTDFANNPIKPGRGFLIQADGEGQKLVFNPGAKRGETTNKPSFINIEAGNANFMDRACVQIGSGNTLRKMTINDNVSHVYVMHDGKDYAAATITEAQGEMPVSFRANENGQYTLTVNPEGVEMNYLHLIDNMTGADIDLLQTPSYTFNATTTDYESRFRLVFAANNEDGASTGSASFAFYSNGNWIINNVGEATLQVIDLTGRILSSETVNGSVSTTINATPGVYMIRLVNGENVKVQKIVVR